MNPQYSNVEMCLHHRIKVYLYISMAMVVKTKKEEEEGMKRNDEKDIRNAWHAFKTMSTDNTRYKFVKYNVSKVTFPPSKIVYLCHPK